LPKSWQQEKPDHLNQGNPAVFQHYPLRPEVFRPRLSTGLALSEKIGKNYSNWGFNVNRNFMVIL